MKTPDTSRVAEIFLTLSPEDQEEIFQVGATFRLKSPLKGLQSGVHRRGRRPGDRAGGRPARSALQGRFQPLAEQLRGV